MRIVVLFAFGLVLRLLFQAATVDGGTWWHVGFQGDAPVWQKFAAQIAHGIPDVELRLPWRPPGMTYGVAWLWNGEGSAWPVRLLFTVLGAATAPLLWLLLRHHVAPAIAWTAAVLCACAGNMLLLASGLHVETPYLFFVLVTLLDQQRLANGGGAWVALRWGALHGLLCLLRGEHVLSFAALAAVAVVSGVRWRALALALLGASVPLVPWQLHANRLVADFNAGAPVLPASEPVWRADAIEVLRTLPSFQQAPMFDFVTRTMRVRGATEVRARDLEVVREAFGVFPEPIRPAFVALQGGMNFWLASIPEGGGGYSGAGYDRPPPLLGGASRYPPGLAAELPRGGQFALNHPPHLDIFLHGYARGWQELAADPWAALQRLASKVWNGIGGATGGIGGYALPIGMSGLRRPVDMVAASGVWPGIWRVLVLGVAAVGLWRLRRVAVVQALVAFALTRVLMLMLFFGHARFGALCLPAVVLGVAAVLQVALADRVRGRLWSLLPAVFLVAVAVVEVVRCATVAVEVDGRPWTQPPGGEADYKPHVITFR